MAWRNISHAKHKCEHHLVWWPKRRRVLADAEVRTRVCETFRAIAEELGFGIEELNVGDNHVHLRLESLPKYSSARVVDILKSNSPNRAFREFSWLRWKYWSGELWEDGYAVHTVGYPHRIRTGRLRP